MFTLRSSIKVSLGLGLIFALIHPAFSQIIPRGTETLVIPQGNQINITGGTQAGANLFHTFRDFNLNSAQIANFLSNPQTQNIFGRINGGNPSFINGLLQVTGGNSNLFLMNPAGIVFGANASLNVPASFTATTANQIGFGNNQYFSALGNNNYATLIGNPNSFIFNTTQAGSIVNAGNLAVGTGQNISLIAGNTVNTGRLTAPSGEIQLLAVAGTNRVRLSQPGQVLSLEFVPPINGEFRAIDLPALLTGNDLPGIQVNPSGQVQVAGTSLPNQQGLSVASGRIDVSSATGNGGVVQVMGDRVAALNSRINANGATGGGVVRLGGEYLGGIDTGIAPAFRFNSQRTLVDRNSLIRANATVTGAGGRVIVWADQSTGYFGRITGRGATGIGAFVEVSGRENLAFDGRVELQGSNGLGGTLLLDPTNIIISGVGTDNAQLADATILSGDLPATMFISAGALTAIPAGTAINITASGNIDFQTNVTLIGGGTAPVSFTAATITSSGTYTLNTRGRNLNIVADSINAPNLTIQTRDFGIRTGDIQITANTGNLQLGDFIATNGSGINGGAITLNAIQGNITTGHVRTHNTVGIGNGGAVNFSAPQGNITTGDVLTYASNGNGRAINLTARGNIAANEVQTFSSNGNGGNINVITTQGNITANLFRSTGNTPGNTSGNININAGNWLRVTGTNPSCANASICSNGFGTAGNGTITIQYGGGISNPFIIGNAAINGTAGRINAGGADILNPVLTIPSSSYQQGIIQILTTPPPPVIVPLENSSTSNSLLLFALLQNPAAPPTPAPVIVGTPPEPPSTLELSASIPLVEAPIPNPVVNPIAELVPSPNVLLNPPTNTIEAPIAIPVTTPAATSIPLSSPNLHPSVNLLPDLQVILAGGTINPLISPENLETSLPLLIFPGVITNPTSVEVSARLEGLENAFQADFQQYLGLVPQTYRETQANSESSNQEFTLDSINQQTNNQYSFSETQAKLNRITETTRVKPALIYVFFAPPNGSNDFNSANLAAQTTRTAKDSDSLEVILINGQGQPVRVQFPHTTRRQVLEVANEFRSEVTNFRNSRGYLQPAKQMYSWILEALEPELQKQEIDNLVFLMDTGLRSIPLAAMHDGNGFVIERYSVGLMPSLNLTEPNYNSLEGAQVLAMGATTFTDAGLEPLPAVSLELNTISQLWEGIEFLNDHFTLLNLIQQRQNRPFRMIHLATHAVFSPGDRANSYIQLWDRKLSLDQLSQLNWGNPPVDLLVLSACQTALGDRDAELGFASLAINAGVRSALASLWEVNDTATLGLMTKFYQQLQVTTTKAEALRQAQLAMLRGEVRLEGGNLVTINGTIPLTDELRNLGDLRLNHPYYWSAFTMVGNPW